ncbi:MAG: hypothetical protein WBV22_01650 [Anaerolineaceae bacterium]
MRTFLWPIRRDNIKKTDKHAFIDLLRFIANGISRDELLRQLNHSRTTITEIINNQQTIGLISKIQGRCPSGRKSIVPFCRNISGMGVMDQTRSLKLQKGVESEMEGGEFRINLHM